MFIDRNPSAFCALIDFIRNGGEVFGAQKEHMDLLDNELHFWGISKTDFSKPHLDKYDLIQEMIDRPLANYQISDESFGLN